MLSASTPSSAPDRCGRGNFSRVRDCALPRRERPPCAGGRTAAARRWRPRSVSLGRDHGKTECREPRNEGLDEAQLRPAFRADTAMPPVDTPDGAGGRIDKVDQKRERTPQLPQSIPAKPLQTAQPHGETMAHFARRENHSAIIGKVAGKGQWQNRLAAPAGGIIDVGMDIIFDTSRIAANRHRALRSNDPKATFLLDIAADSGRTPRRRRADLRACRGIAWRNRIGRPSRQGHRQDRRLHVGAMTYATSDDAFIEAPLKWFRWSRNRPIW